MRYKVEIIMGGEIYREYFFPNLTHPKQAARNVVEQLRGKIDYFIMVIANDYGEVWKMATRRDMKGVYKIRVMQKYGPIMNKDDVDMVFTRNINVFGGVVG